MEQDQYEEFLLTVTATLEAMGETDICEAKIKKMWEEIKESEA